MTMQMPQGQPPQLPNLGYPRIMVMVTENLAPSGSSDDQTTDWRVGAPHPLVPGMNVVAMYVNGDLVEVYSVSHSVTGAMRDLIQLRHTRLIQETMPLNIFAEELARAELGPDDNDDEDDEGDEDDDESPPPSQERVAQTSQPQPAQPQSARAQSQPVQPTQPQAPKSDSPSESSAETSGASATTEQSPS